MDLKKRIRIIPDFPEKGVIYHDITPLLRDGPALKYVVNKIVSYFKGKEIDYVAGIEARGFILGSILAHELGVGFIPIRKQGLLPYKTIKKYYIMEYGNRTIEMHTDAIERGQKVLLVDDVVATGGTIEAAIELVENLGGNIAGIAILILNLSPETLKKLEDYDAFYIFENRDGNIELFKHQE